MKKERAKLLVSNLALSFCDMLEYSNFLQYKANRAEYINALWNIVNWNIVNKRFEEINLDLKMNQNFVPFIKYYKKMEG